MYLAQYVVQAVRVEGRTVRDVAASYDITRAWVYELLKRYDAGGLEALEPRSRAPQHRPHRIPDHVEERIVVLRKQLLDAGFDAGATTLQTYLTRQTPPGGYIPSIAGIHRVLTRRGFINPQPHKRPRSSWIRFEADLPNERWQADTTHWRLADGSGIEILNVIDDHSRFLISTTVRRTFTALDVVTDFVEAFDRHGMPASVLTDNGAIFTARARLGRTGLENLLINHGITGKNSRPYHPQTCGKVERFHQTMKKWLVMQPDPGSLRLLQRQLGHFTHHYNHIRPHRAIARRTPAEAYTARAKAIPTNTPAGIDGYYRVRADKIHTTGTVTLRHAGRLHHIGVGRAYAGARIIIATADLHIRISTLDGQLIREFTLDPTRDYQPHGRR